MKTITQENKNFWNSPLLASDRHINKEKLFDDLNVYLHQLERRICLLEDMQIEEQS